MRYIYFRHFFSLNCKRGTASFTTDTSDKLITLNSQNAITGQVTFDTTGTGGDVSFDNGTKLFP